MRTAMMTERDRRYGVMMAAAVREESPSSQRARRMAASSAGRKMAEVTRTPNPTSSA